MGRGMFFILVKMNIFAFQMVKVKYKILKSKVKKSGLEFAFEDIEKGHVHRLITPKKFTASNPNLKRLNLRGCL